MIQMTRTTLGPLFSEGARQLWLRMQSKKWSRGKTAARLEVSRGQLSKLLYGDQKPGRTSAERLRTTLGIAPALWDALPVEAFVPPAAQAAASSATP